MQSFSLFSLEFPALFALGVNPLKHFRIHFSIHGLRFLSGSNSVCVFLTNLRVSEFALSTP